MKKTGYVDEIVKSVWLPIGSALCLTSIKDIEKNFRITVASPYKKVRGGNSYIAIGKKKNVDKFDNYCKCRFYL